MVMNRCPKCGARFTDDNAFCLDDGTALVGESGHAETVVLPISAATANPRGTPEHRNSPRSKPSSPTVYILIGAMAATIVALGIVLYLTRDGIKGPAAENKAKPETPSNSANTTAARTPTNSSAETSLREGPASITESTARDVLNRWREAQNGRDFTEYANLYAPAFVGYKVTPSGETDRMNRDQWLRDRREMLPNFIEVQVVNERIRIDGATAVVTFTQRWRSARHCDIGEKELTIQIITGRPQIRSEVLRNPYPC